MVLIKHHTLEEVFEFFRKYNEDYNVGYHSPKPNELVIKCNVTFAQDNFKNKYSKRQRTYIITNRSGKRFFDMPSCSRSVFMDCVVGPDKGVRYDYYNWTVESVKLYVPRSLIEYYEKVAKLDFDTWLERQPKGTYVQGGGV